MKPRVSLDAETFPAAGTEREIMSANPEILKFEAPSPLDAEMTERIRKFKDL